MSYDLRRLRLHGLIERVLHSHRCQPTTLGLRVALFFCCTYARLLRPILAEIAPHTPLSALSWRGSKPSSTKRARAHNSPPDKLDSFALYFMMQVL
jgi:hypothetical protein